MNFNSDDALEQFVRRFFEVHGAEIDKSSHGLDVLLPDHLALRLQTPEFLQLTTEADNKEKFAVQYGTPLLEKIVNTACGTAPVAGCRLNFHYIKRQGFDRLIQDRFVFHNCAGRVIGTAEVQTVYLLLACRYLAQSDEQKEGLFPLVFNLETGAAAPEMAGMLDSVEKTFEEDSVRPPLGGGKIENVLKWVQRQAGLIVEKEIEPFQDSMNRRFHRDVANLEEYYADLKLEMQASLKRPGISAQLMSDREAKISLIPGELERKKSDLFKKYSIRVKLALCGGIQIVTPAVKILYETSHGRKKKQLSLIYNPVTKSLDPLVCDGCADSTFSVRFCSHLHLLCPACGANCPAC